MARGPTSSSFTFARIAPVWQGGLFGGNDRAPLPPVQRVPSG